SRSDIEPESPIEELEDGNGFRISSGSIKINVEGKEVSLKGLTATFRFCENDRLIAIEGSTAIPSPIDCLDFGEAAGTKIGFYTGQSINGNPDINLDFDLAADRAYFVFQINTQLAVNICTDPANPDTKPLKLEVPGTGAQYLFIADFADPFYYLDLPKFKVAESAQALFNFNPIQPVPEMETFGSRGYFSGSFPIYGVIQVTGHLYQNLVSPLRQLTSDNPLDFPIEEGFKGGINGYVELGLPLVSQKSNKVSAKKKKGDKNEGENKDETKDKDEIELDTTTSITDILTFSIPLGETSAALTAVPVEGQIFSRAYFNTLIQPDNSWWPNFIPAKPNGALTIAGFAQQGGQFYFVLRGELGLQRSDTDGDLVNCTGELKIDNDALQLRGELNGLNEGWAVQARIGKETDINLQIPASLTDNFVPDVQASIVELEGALEAMQKDLENAKTQLDLELSLRGLKAKVPGIIAYAKKQLAAAERKIYLGIPSVFRRVLCRNPAKDYTKAHHKALDRLNRAIKADLSLEQQRIEIEAALRGVIKNRYLRVSKIRIQTKSRCKSRTITLPSKYRVNTNVLSSGHVATLTQAAENVQYIMPASNKVVNLADEIGTLPNPDIIEKMKSFQVPTLNAVGYLVEAETQSFQYYFQLGDELYFRDFDPFDWQSILEEVTNVIEELVRE
ncbi:MAG: hypothetical protein AAF705_02710, partial [Bacteroidota bacterium]